MATGIAAERPRLAPLPTAVALGVAWLGLLLLQVTYGTASEFDFGFIDALHGFAAAAGLADPLPTQLTFEQRLWRALAAGGVGGLLALAGALLQGLFRNGLASPSLIGVTAGANLGATAAMLLLGGYGAALAFDRELTGAPYLVTGAAFLGALAVCAFVVAVAGRDGRVSVPTLLLVGVAINTCIAGALTAVQNLLDDDWDTMRAIQSWSLGVLDDRQPYHAVLVVGGLVLTAAMIPLVAGELDLLAAGEDDARALGVATGRTLTLVLATAAIGTACAVATAGQVGFVGLIVPHLIRLLVGSSHRAVLPLSILGGAVFLLATDVAQLLVLGEHTLRPGVLMSLIGGPMFLALLLRSRSAGTW